MSESDQIKLTMWLLSVVIAIVGIGYAIGMIAYGWPPTETVECTR